MGSTTRLLAGAGLTRRLVSITLAAMFIVSMLAGPAASAQDATEEAETPDVVVPGTGEESQDFATPDAEEPATEEDEPAPEPAQPKPVSGLRLGAVALSRSFARFLRRITRRQPR